MAPDDTNTQGSPAVWPPPPFFSAETRTSASGLAYVSLLPLARWVVVGLGANIVTGVLALITDPVRSPDRSSPVLSPASS